MPTPIALSLKPAIAARDRGDAGDRQGLLTRAVSLSEAKSSKFENLTFGTVRTFGNLVRLVTTFEISLSF